MSVTDPTEPVERPRPTGGVDWAKDDHAVAVVAPDGEQTLRFSITHDAGTGHSADGRSESGRPTPRGSVTSRTIRPAASTNARSSGIRQPFIQRRLGAGYG